MFYLKCQKEEATDTFYIWANDNNLYEWCISEVPCFFQDYTIVENLLNMVKDSSNSLKNIFIVEEP